MARKTLVEGGGGGEEEEEEEEKEEVECNTYYVCSINV